MVPGGKRKLQQYHYKKTLLKHEKQQYDLLSSSRLKLESEYGQFTTDTPPDVCSTSHCPLLNVAHYDLPTLPEECYEKVQVLAGQTVPITIKTHNIPSGYSSLPLTNFETTHHSEMLNEGLHGSMEVDRAASSSYYSDDCQGGQRNTVISEALQVFNFNSRRPNKRNLGSAV